MRRVLADGLRSSPYQCNCIVGAVDIPSKTLSMDTEPTEVSSSSSSTEEIKGTPHLYYLDYLGSLCEVPFTAQGYCSHMLYGLWDSIWKRDMDYDDGIRMLLASIKHMQKRFIVAQNNWIAKIITKDGIRRIDIGAEAERLGITLDVKPLPLPSSSAPSSTATTTTTSSSSSQ